MRKSSIALIAIVILLVSMVGAGLVLQTPTNHTLVLATTTSTQDSGLLDYLLPDFESKYNARVYVVAVGSGTALTYGKNGDADVLLVHDPDNERRFVADGYGTNRTQVMYNRFVIVGPSDDPGGVRSSTNTSEAFQKIFDNGTEGKAKFISRGDNSGTNNKELKIWGMIGLNASAFSDSWYDSVGQGMGATLLMCEEESSYTLADEATFYTYLASGKMPHLELLYQGDEILFNQYSVILVNSERWPNIDSTLATAFLSWFISPSVQAMVGNFSDPYGHHLFTPNAEVSSKVALDHSGETSNSIRADEWAIVPCRLRAS